MAKVLLVEDERLLADLYKVILVQAGHKVWLARDAQAALDELDRCKTDIVLLDMMLPGHNGIEVLHEMQSFVDWRDLPIIILSARNESDFGLSKPQWRSYGVVEYLYKPATKAEDLVDAVNRYAKS